MTRTRPTPRLAVAGVAVVVALAAAASTVAVAAASGAFRSAATAPNGQCAFPGLPGTLVNVELQVLPGWLGRGTNTLHVALWEIARMVLIVLGVPLVGGYLTRRVGIARRVAHWYTTEFLPRISPLALWGLLFTVVILFALQGKKITSQPWDVARIAVPLLAYFGIMWAAALAVGVRLHLPYPRTATLAFTAASNNFELAIAVAIGVFGVTSGQALAGVVGPLIEVPHPGRAGVA